MIIVTKEDVEKRLQEKFPNEPFEILKYTRMTQPFSIKCLKCGEVRNSTQTANFINANKHICLCYDENHWKTKHKNNKKRIQELLNNSETKELIKFNYDREKKKSQVFVLCKKCQQIYVKSFQSFFHNAECPYCENRQLFNNQAFLTVLSKEYQPLEEYKGYDNKILIRHECGFIWKVTPHKILASKYTGCPKCNKRSVGEKIISKWFDKHAITYEIEKTFDWQSNHRWRYDFYLPDYNLVIEFMGKQHYVDIDFFSRKQSFERRQEIDYLKKEEALEQNMYYLAISYKDQSNINQILKNWFNDYPERE